MTKHGRRHLEIAIDMARRGKKVLYVVVDKERAVDNVESITGKGVWPIGLKLRDVNHKERQQPEMIWIDDY